MIEQRTNWKLYHEDRLVRRFKFVVRLPDGRLPTHSQGKRVGRDCPLTREEIRAYVEHGTIHAVKIIKDTRFLSLKESLDLLNAARGEEVSRR